jgi:uncharacterized protein DUF6600
MSTRHLICGVGLAALMAAAPIALAQAQGVTQPSQGAQHSGPSTADKPMKSDAQGGAERFKGGSDHQPATAQGSDKQDRMKSGPSTAGSDRDQGAAGKPSSASQAAGAPNSPDKMTTAATGKASVSEFRQRLSPMGETVRVQGLGEVWKPRNMAADWRPYSNGRWIFNEKVGWYFDSPEDWAEITYHYGRWYKDPTEGWVWIAGDEWAPAWVEWRRGKKFVGWRPLPPDNAPRVARRQRAADIGEVEEVWTFVPEDKLVSERIETVMIEPRRTLEIYRDSRELGRIERRGGISVNFALRPEVIQRESNIRVTSQNLPQTQLAPVPQQVRSISTEQRMTTGAVSGSQRQPSGESGSSTTTSGQQQPSGQAGSAATSGDKTGDKQGAASKEPSSQSGAANAPAQSDKPAQSKMGERTSDKANLGKRDVDKSTTGATQKSEKPGETGGKASMPDRDKAADKSSSKAEARKAGDSKPDMSSGKSESDKAAPAGRAEGKKPDRDPTTGSTQKSNEPAERPKAGADKRSDRGGMSGGMAEKGAGAGKKSDTTGSIDKPSPAGGAAKEPAGGAMKETAKPSAGEKPERKPAQQ